PGRLKEELAAIANLLSGNDSSAVEATAATDHALHQHSTWIQELAAEHGIGLADSAAQQLVEKEVGNKFLAVLLDAGVYKRTEHGQKSFKRFIHSLNFNELQ